MYPSLPDVDIDRYGEATLPDGRKVWVHETGTIEGDTHAFAEDKTAFRWADTGEDLTPKEFNIEIEREGRKYYLHEYVCKFAKWED